MEMRERVAEWAARMGYVGAIPKNFEHMCTPKTAHVWEQLLSKARPRPDVEKVRHNILMHRVNNPSEVNDLLYPPVRELELFQRKRRLDEEINSVGDNIAELNRKISHASVQNKIKYVQVDNARAKTKEAQHKTFLLESKSRALRNDLAQARGKLAVCEGLTPEPTAQTKEEVLDALKEHADKIGGLISEDVYELKAAGGLDLTGEIRKFEEDESLLKGIKGVLRRSDNRLLWAVLLEEMNGSRIDLRSFVGKELEEINVAMPEDNSGAEDALHAGFAEAELKAMLHEQGIKKLRAELDGQRGKIFEALRRANLQKNVADDATKLLLLQAENAGLRAACDVVAAQIRASNASSGSTLELQKEQGKSLDVQQRIVDVFRNVEFKGRLCERVRARLSEVKGEIPARALKLGPLVGDVRWARPLADDVATEEIRVFDRFSLERNRQIADSLEKLVTDDLVGCEDLDGNSLYMLAATVDCPFSPSESALLNLIRERAKLSVQRALPDGFDAALDYKKYDLEEFKAQEAHVEHSVCRLGALMKPSNAGRVLSALSKVKREVELWLEMPLGDFVDGKRLFNERNCLHYQSLYDSHYNQLQ